MKFIILLALVALGSANILRGQQKEIRVNDNRIFIRDQGKIVVINGFRDDQRCILVFVKDQDRLIRKTKICTGKENIEEILFANEESLQESVKRQNEEMFTSSSDEQTTRGEKSEVRTQDDNQQITVLVNIFKKYQGVIEDGTFKLCLKEIKQAVDDNKLPQVVFDILNDLEVKNSWNNPAYFWMRWRLNKKGPMTGLRDQERDTGTQTDTQADTFFGNEDQLQNVNQQNVRRENKWNTELQEAQRQNEDNLSGTERLPEFTTNMDSSKEEFLEQLAHQNRIRELQGQITHYQLRAQQLQLHQQFVNQQKQQTKLRIAMEQQRGLPVRHLTQECEKLQEKEQGLLRLQLTLHRTIQKLQQEIIQHGEQLQQSLEDEQKRNEKFGMKIF